MPTYSKCRCCDHQVEIKTIDDMLERAYKIIDEDTKITQLLKDLNLDKYSVGITQEYTRLKMLSDPHANFIEDYRCIQESESSIYLGFNENFTVLEEIEIMPTVFSNNYIRGYKAQFNTLANEQKMAFLENAFANYHPTLKGLSSYVEVKYLKDYIDTEIVLKMPNDRVANNLAFAFYPDCCKYPYFTFDIDHEAKKGRVQKIKLKLSESKQIEEPVSKWLHQTVVTMYPDYGCYLWFDGGCGCLEDFEEYDLQDTNLAQKLEDWHGVFEQESLQSDADWIEFNKVGKKLYMQLRDTIKNDYILTYAKSYEETCDTQAGFE
jgi:hypothetical protein